MYYVATIVPFTGMQEGEKVGVPVEKGGQNLPHLVRIGLTDLPKIGDPPSSGITVLNYQKNRDIMFILKSCVSFESQLPIYGTIPPSSNQVDQLPRTY